MPKSSGKVPARSFGSVVDLDLLGNLKKLHKPRKHFAYQIDVSWSDGVTRRVYRSYDQVNELFTFLSNITKDGGLVKLTGRQLFERTSSETFATKHLRQIEIFVNSLLQIPPFMQQSDMFLWFWEPNSEDIRVSDIDRTLDINTSKYNVPSAMVLNAGSLPTKEEDQDYICVCTALSAFTGAMSEEMKEEKGLAVKEGDVIYVLRMSNCPAGFWMVRNVFGSEGMVPVTALRVDQDILQRKKRRSQRIQQQQQQQARLDMIKSAENLADRSMRLQRQKRMEMMRSAENLSRRKSAPRPQTVVPGATPHSPPPMSRTLRDLNNSILTYVDQPSYMGAGRRRSTRNLNNYNDSVCGEQQATHDLIKSLHETSLMLQDRMALSEMETQRRRLFEDLHRPAVPVTAGNRSRRSELPTSEALNLTRGRSSFVRSPSSRRGVRVSGRFKRMSPSPTKFISPCRKGIKGLRVAAPSPLATTETSSSPSQNVTFDQSPGTGLKRPTEGDSPTSKRACSPPVNKESTVDSGLATSKDTSGLTEQEGAAKPRRRSDIARRVSMRLKHVYGKSPVRAKVPRRNVVSEDKAV